LGKKRRLRVFENKVLRRIYGSKRDEVTGERRKLHNQNLNDLYCTPNTVRVIKSRIEGWAGLVVRIGKTRGVYRVGIRIPKGKRPLGRLGRRLDDIIKMYL
jgi:hypothetical protein